MAPACTLKSHVRLSLHRDTTVLEHWASWKYLGGHLGSNHRLYEWQGQPYYALGWASAVSVACRMIRLPLPVILLMFATISGHARPSCHPNKTILEHFGSPGSILGSSTQFALFSQPPSACSCLKPNNTDRKRSFNPNPMTDPDRNYYCPNKLMHFSRTLFRFQVHRPGARTDYHHNDLAQQWTLINKEGSP